MNTNFPSSAPIPREGSKAENSSPGIFSMEHWQALFDVTDEDLKRRLGVIADPRMMQISEDILAKPELYLPFWISAVLVVCVFVFGNLSWAGGADGFSFDVISLAISYVYGYLVFFSGVIHLYARIQNAKSQLFALTTLLGYSLVFYIPAAVLGCVPSALFQYACFLGAFAFSALLLWKNLRKVVGFEGENAAYATSLMVVGVHFLFTLFFKIKFYRSA